METFVGNTIKIVLKTGVDLSGYSTLLMKFRRPDGSTGHWYSSISSTNNTWMEYTTTPLDLNQPGVWAIQANIQDPVGPLELDGRFVEFTVFKPIPDTTLAPTTPSP